MKILCICVLALIAGCCVAAEPTWNPTERISLALAAIWNEQKYVGSDRSDRIQSQQISLTYVPRDAWSVP